MRSPGRSAFVAAAFSTVVMLAVSVGRAEWQPAAATTKRDSRLLSSRKGAVPFFAAPARQVMGAGPADRPPVDAAAADKGKVTWTASCASCHGADARGTEKGKNLIRSTMVLHDRNGSEIGPYLKKGHPADAPATSTNLTDAQVNELAQFLRQRVNDSFRGSPIFEPRNVLTGDPKAGETYFNGGGRCATCHSPTGDLAGIGKKYEPVDLQQRMVFPRAPQGRGGAIPAQTKATATVTVTPKSGTAVTGVLVELNDFTVTLRDASGVTRTFERGPDLTVQKNDPLAVHREMLDTLTDKNIHDLVAYLETLK
jgi:mono/diheme cytochrome c family protein